MGFDVYLVDGIGREIGSFCRRVLWVRFESVYLVFIYFYWLYLGIKLYLIKNEIEKCNFVLCFGRKGNKFREELIYFGYKVFVFFVGLLVLLR